MPVKSKRVNLSVSPSQERGILDVGRENNLHSTDGSLKVSTVSMQIINFILKLHKNEDVARYLEKNGGTLFDLIRKGVENVVKSG